MGRRPTMLSFPTAFQTFTLLALPDMAWRRALCPTETHTLPPKGLKATWGLDITIPADRAFLTTPINSRRPDGTFPVIERFPFLANPNNVYPGFPSAQPLIQALRPHPQWNGVPPFLGPPLGNTWYDSLQAKVVQRLTRGLTVQGAYTW